MLRCHITLLACVTVVGLVGCGMPWLFGDSTTPLILSVENGEVLLDVEEFVKGYFDQASLWRLDLETGELQHLLGPSPYGRWEAAGDYYVTEELTDDYQTGSVVAGRFSTGAQVTICERHYSEFGPDFVYGYFVEGERAVVGVEGGVLIYDLATFSEMRRIELPEVIRDIRALCQGRVFATGSEDGYGGEALYLIDVDSGEVVQLADAPREGELCMPSRNIHLTSEWVITDQTVELEETDDSGGIWARLFDKPVVRDEVLGYHIPTQRWEVLAQYEPYDPDDTSAFESYVAGGEETQVLVERTAYFPGRLRLEAIDLTTGEPRLLIEGSGGTAELAYAHISPALVDDRLYWIDGNTNELVIHDLETGEEQRIATIAPAAE
jgi:hypothetical protein